MALAAVTPLAFEIKAGLDLAVWVLSVSLLLWAFIHATLQRPDAFAAIGGLQKQHWMGVLGIGFLLSLLIGWAFALIVYVGIAAATYYLLETRRGLKDASEGSW